VIAPDPGADGHARADRRARPDVDPAVGSAAARHRIFIAVPLAAELRGAPALIRGMLGAHAGAFRWVGRDTLHLTLRFLGEITSAQVERAIEAAGLAARGAVPFSITLAGAGAFPSFRAPRVLWVGVTEGATPLVALAGALEAALAERQFPREPRPFHPHFTVARARQDGRSPDLGALAARLAGPDAPVVGTQIVRALTVVESTLHPAGAVHRELSRAEIGGA